MEGGASQVSLGAETLCPSPPIPALDSVDPHVRPVPEEKEFHRWVGWC